MEIVLILSHVLYSNIFKSSTGTFVFVFYSFVDLLRLQQKLVLQYVMVIDDMLHRFHHEFEQVIMHQIHVPNDLHFHLEKQLTNKNKFNISI